MSKNNDCGRHEASLKAETERLKRELQELGAIHTWVSDDLPPEQQNHFLRRILAFEPKGTTTLLAQLQRIGIDVPPPATLSDDALTQKLWAIINGLADLRVFLERTDHLSDRDLYELLHDELLPDEMDEVEGDEGTAWHIDTLGRCSNEDLRLQLKYYADEEQRREWLADWPDYDMPAHQDPPYDRDRLLPACESGSLAPRGDMP